MTVVVVNPFLTRDPYQLNNELLIHGYQNFNDSSVNTKTITNAGSVSISTAQKLYDSASMLFAGGYLQTPSSPFDFQSNNFTIESWIFRTGGDASGPILNIRPAGSASGWGFSAGAFFGSINGVWRGTVISASVALNTWIHVALVRNANTFTLYQNGISVGSYTQSGALNNNSSNLTIGYGGATSEAALSGHLYDLRITKGIARYTSSFTPPISRLPD